MQQKKSWGSLFCSVPLHSASETLSSGEYNADNSDIFACQIDDTLAMHEKSRQIQESGSLLCAVHIDDLHLVELGLH